MSYAGAKDVRRTDGRLMSGDDAYVLRMPACLLAPGDARAGVMIGLR